MDNIKLIIFDLDGVLVDTKDIHYAALNYAQVEDLYIGKEELINQILKYNRKIV